MTQLTHASLAALLFTSACTGDITGGSGPLTVDESTSTYLEGSASLDGHALAFAVSVAGDAVHAGFEIDGVLVEYGVDLADQTIWIDGQSASLDVDQLQFLAALVPHVARRVGADPAALDLAPSMFVASFAHLASAPAGYPLVGRSFGLDEDVQRSLGNNGVSCVYKGQSVWVQWDDYGGAHSQTVVVDDGKHCFGKCGDCGFGPNQWTLDCLEHDQCCRAATGELDWNPWDPQCGDEFDNATDDFMAGVFWGKKCRG